MQMQHIGRGQQREQISRNEEHAARLVKALLDKGVNPILAGITYNSSFAKPLSRYMARCLQDMEEDFLRPLLKHLRFPLGAETASSVIELVELVAEKIKHDEDREMSINTLIHRLSRDRLGAEHTNLTMRPVDPKIRQGTLALLGRLTMSYEIASPVSEKDIYIFKPQTDWMTGDRRPMKDTRDPIGILLRNFGRFSPKLLVASEDQTESEKRPPVAENLSVGLLNAYNLIKIGEVTICWSDLLSAHLFFDPASGTLTLFAFPTFCALNCLPDGQNTFFDRIMDNFRRPQLNIRTENRSMNKEILLSYRLLFGQDERSRDLFRSQERHRANIEGRVDPLLDELCSEAQAMGERFSDNSFIERNAYNSRFRFPFLGQRLALLQDFSHSISPHGVLDVWRDRRDPYKWSAVWFATIIGAVTVMLASGSLAAAIVQIRLMQQE